MAQPRHGPTTGLANPPATSSTTGLARLPCHQPCHQPTQRQNFWILLDTGRVQTPNRPQFCSPPTTPRLPRTTHPAFHSLSVSVGLKGIGVAWVMKNRRHTAWAHQRRSIPRTVRWLARCNGCHVTCHVITGLAASPGGRWPSDRHACSLWGSSCPVRLSTRETSTRSPCGLQLTISQGG